MAQIFLTYCKYIIMYFILVVFKFFAFHQDWENRLEMELCSQPWLRSCLDYMCGYIPHIHTHPHFFHYAQNFLSNIILRDFEHIAIIFTWGGGMYWLLDKNNKLISF